MSVTPLPLPETDTRLAAINARLATLVPEASAWPTQLHAAQRHALLAPGKRFRPLLCVMVAEGCGRDDDAVLDAACVSEMVHAASLILDDLPCMDDADLRRNRPSTHVEFNESTAILTATALLNRAFGVLMGLKASPGIRVELGSMLSYAVGSRGLIAGQIADLANDDPDIASAEVERLNGLKTGALFDFCIEAGAVLAEASASQRSALRDFSQQIGLAFQLLDDLKDVLLSDAQAAKSTGRDAGKATLVHLSGVPEAKRRLAGYMAQAREALRRAEMPNSAKLDALLDAQFRTVLG